MSGRGGVRPGAGRKRILTFKERIRIGALCDNYQRDARIGNAMARWEKQPDNLALKDARERLRGKSDAAKARIVKGEIRPLIKRVVKTSVPVRRGKTRAEIAKMVSDHCVKRGIVGVTPRRVEACWKEYRAFCKASEVDQSGGV